MKIIASMNSGKFLVEISEDEIAKISGCTSAVSMKRRADVGHEIAVSPLWEVLCHARARHNNIAETAEKLRIEAGRLDKINQALESPLIQVRV